VALAVDFLGPNFATTGVSSQARTSYVEKNGAYWDAIDIHHYPKSNNKEDGETLPQDDYSFEGAVPHANYALDTTADILTKEYMSQNWAKGKKIIITEYNASLNNSKLNSSIYGGLFSAEYIMRLSSVPTLNFILQHVLNTGTGIKTNSFALGNTIDQNTTC
jgi:hypothetical protein